MIGIGFAIYLCRIRISISLYINRYNAKEIYYGKNNFNTQTQNVS